MSFGSREKKKKGCEEMNESLHHYNYCDMQHRLNNKRKKNSGNHVVMSVSQRYESHDVKSSEGVNALMSAVLPGCILFLMYLKECCYLCPEINWVSDFFMANYDDAFSVCQVVCWNTGIFGVPFFLFLLVWFSRCTQTH